MTVEHIETRKSLNNISQNPFDKNSLLEISEIGVPTTDIEKEYKALKRAVELPIYSGSLERFCAVGDDNGLFIIINQKLKQEWFPTNDKAISSDFMIKFEEMGNVYEVEFKNKNLRCTTSER